MVTYHELYEVEAVYITDNAVTGVSTEQRWYTTFDLAEIESYAMVLQEDGEPYADRCEVIFKSGVALFIGVTYEQFGKVLKEYIKYQNSLNYNEKRQ